MLIAVGFTSGFCFQSLLGGCIFTGVWATINGVGSSFDIVAGSAVGTVAWTAGFNAMGASGIDR
jgi:hypothetical protein